MSIIPNRTAGYFLYKAAWEFRLLAQSKEQQYSASGPSVLSFLSQPLHALYAVSYAGARERTVVFDIAAFAVICEEVEYGQQQETCVAG